MRTTQIHRLQVLVAMSVFIFWIQPAHAYLDPGTGSAILQGLLAALAALVVTVKLYWYRLLRLLGLRKGDIPDEENEADETSTNESTTGRD